MEPAEVYSAREIARASGVPPRRVVRLMQSGAISTVDGRFVAAGEALRAVRALRGAIAPEAGPSLFVRPPAGRRATLGPLVASGVAHAGGFALVLFLLTLGVERSEAIRETAAKVAPVRLVFLDLPGPGGGGGGGGLRQPAPPRADRLQGTARTPSPVAVRLPRPASQSIPPPPRRRERPASQSIPPAPPRPLPVDAAPEPADAPPPLAGHALPPIVAPVVSLGTDRTTLAGLLGGAGESSSQGPGAGGGFGSGDGTGSGEGSGPGIGPGSGGGTGGGPYRPGSGIEPPRLVQEVRPRYTEEARRKAVEGEVVVEIVVRRDGRVGDVTVLRRLGAGLDDRAVEAVRQWRFEPARRLGEPVDVLVEVAVEFKLR